jgi:hypothetical protein
MKAQAQVTSRLILPKSLRRAAREIFWGNPFLYRILAAVLRRPFLVHATNDYDFWVGGFPRSSNTYTARMLELCLTHQRLLCHIHFPAHIIPMIKSGKPGMFVLREPVGACISWAQYAEQSLGESLDFYIDFHHIMLPYVNRLFVAPFELTTSNFRLVLDDFNRYYGLSLTLPDYSPSRVMEAVETNWTNEDGSVEEMRVARPSAVRAAQRQKYLAELAETPKLSAALEAAHRLYQTFREKSAAGDRSSS